MAFVLPNPTVGPDIDNAELLANFERIRTVFMGLRTTTVTDQGPNFAAKYVDVPVVIGPFNADDVGTAAGNGAVSTTASSTYIDHFFTMPHFADQGADPWYVKDILISGWELNAGNDLLVSLEVVDPPPGFGGATLVFNATMAAAGAGVWRAIEPTDVPLTTAQRYMRAQIGATAIPRWTNVTLSFTIRYLLSESTVG